LPATTRRQSAAPGADVLRADAFDLQHQRHAGDGEVDGGVGRPEVQQAVAARQVEQAVAQVGQHAGAASGGAGLAGQGAFDVEGERRVAPAAQALGQRLDIGGAAMAVHRRHLDNQRGQDRVQALGSANRLWRWATNWRRSSSSREIQAAGQRREHHAEPEDVGDLVVVAGEALPAQGAGQVDRAHDRRAGVALHCQVLGLMASLAGAAAFERADDVQAR
jgi:hypothetical protein